MPLRFDTDYILGPCTNHSHVAEWLADGHDERYVIEAIRKHLLTPEQRRWFENEDTSISDVLNGRIGDSHFVDEMFADWNKKLGRDHFGYAAPQPTCAPEAVPNCPKCGGPRIPLGGGKPVCVVCDAQRDPAFVPRIGSVQELESGFKWSVEVITDGPAPVNQQEALGWGEGAISTNIGSRAKCIKICREGELMLTFRITEDGCVTISDSAHSNYQTWIGQNFEIEPLRPWNKK